jgi:selenocysteine lyase/cysteine desulfurase
VAPALEAILSADRPRLARHLEDLTGHLLRGLKCLRHSTGAALVTIHGPGGPDGRGATVAVTLRDSRGKVLPYWVVEADARSAGLAIRGGCFCNPGCAEGAFGWSGDATAPCLDSLGADFTVPQFAKCLGEGPVGAIRLSLGLGSLRRDVDVALTFLRRYLGEARERGSSGGQGSA